MPTTVGRSTPSSRKPERLIRPPLPPPVPAQEIDEPRREQPFARSQSAKASSSVPASRSRPPGIRRSASAGAPPVPRPADAPGPCPERCRPASSSSAIRPGRGRSPDARRRPGKLCRHRSIRAMKSSRFERHQRVARLRVDPDHLAPMVEPAHRRHAAAAAPPRYARCNTGWSGARPRARRRSPATATGRAPPPDAATPAAAPAGTPTSCRRQRPARRRSRAATRADRRPIPGFPTRRRS